MKQFKKLAAPLLAAALLMGTAACGGGGATSSAGTSSPDSSSPSADAVTFTVTADVYINDEDEITNVCEGTNIKNDKNHYMNRKQITGDLHAHAPLLWCATELLTK